MMKVVTGIIFILIVIVFSAVMYKNYMYNNSKMTSIKDVYALNKKVKPLYKMVDLGNIFKKYPKKVQGLTFGYICPGAMKTVEYLNKTLRGMSEGTIKTRVKKITNEIKLLTDLQFFVEIYVIYRKFIYNDLAKKMGELIGAKGCQISELITDRITVLFGQLPVKIKSKLPDDFYHIRHNTLICSKNKKLAEKRIELLKSLYSAQENFANICDGKRDGVSGCRDCCSSNVKNKDYSNCVDSCMRY